VAKYKRRWEKVRKEKEALEAEKGDLQRQLEETHSRVEDEGATRAEKVAKAKHQAYVLART